jgi:hypothetical protein
MLTCLLSCAKDNSVSIVSILPKILRLILNRVTACVSTSLRYRHVYIQIFICKSIYLHVHMLRACRYAYIYINILSYTHNYVYLLAYVHVHIYI